MTIGHTMIAACHRGRSRRANGPSSDLVVARDPLTTPTLLSSIPDLLLLFTVPCGGTQRQNPYHLAATIVWGHFTGFAKKELEPSGIV